MFSFKHSSWFIRKVICWRAVASVAWSVLLLPVTTTLFVFLSRFSLLHPIQWISDSLALLTASSTIFSLVLLSGVVLVIGFFTLESYAVVPSIPCTRIALLGKVLHPWQCIHSVVHSAVGMLVSWCAAITIGGRYRTLGYPCIQPDSEDTSQICLNEYHLLLLLFGAFMGYSHSLLGVVHNMNYVSFPPYRLPASRGEMQRHAVHVCTEEFPSAILLFGYAPKTWICRTLNLQEDGSLHALDTLAGLLDFSLLYHLWITGTFLLLTWYITVLLFRIYVSETYSFPVQPSFAEETEECLPKVLLCKEPAIMKFLALQDLALLSQHSAVRRMEVFSLSQPGGHPHNWNGISKECLFLLTELTQRLVAHHDAVASNGRAKSQSSSGSTDTKSGSWSSASSGPTGLPKTPLPSHVLKTPGSVFLRSSVGTLHSPLTAPFTPDLDSPFSSPSIRRLTAPQEPGSPWFGSVQSPHVMRRGPKLWSASTDSQTNGSSTASPSPATAAPAAAPASSPPAAVHKPNFLSQWLLNRKEQVKGFMAKRVLVMYLFNKLPEATSQALFADSQAHIWALEGLSHLVVASYSEDRFGVVQTTLSSILSTMLVLQEAVDRHFKLPHASSKPLRPTCSMGDSTYKTLRFAVRAALKTAIYRITNTFGEHLHAVQMSADHRKRLQQFLEYKE